MRVLITGFEPFGGETVNSGYEAVKILPGKIKGADIIKLELPTVFEKEGKVLENAVKEYLPDITICVGQAGTRSEISVEKVAINLMEARIPDNEGNQPIDKIIYKDGNTAYFANLPLKAMVKNIREHKIPAQISYTAGTFVCNDVMYRLLYIIEKKYPKMQGGFIHVPYLTEQTVNLPKGTPSMSVQTIANALEYGIETAIEGKETKGKVGNI